MGPLASDPTTVGRNAHHCLRRFIRCRIGKSKLAVISSQGSYTYTAAELPDLVYMNVSASPLPNRTPDHQL